MDQKAAVVAQVAVGGFAQRHISRSRGLTMVTHGSVQSGRNWSTEIAAELKTSPSPIFRLLRELRDELED
jgi:hypothetical protein